MNRFFIFTAGALALTAGAAVAEDRAGDGAGDGAGEATVLETIVVTTPLRRDSSLERSTSTVTVIGAEEIRRSPALDLPALLATVPGVNFNAYGGMGAGASIGIRGARAEQTLILVDGVNVRSATLGSIAIYNIPLGSVERIEIARGAHSAQYGSDAIGGVINIITRTGNAGCPGRKDVCTTVSTGVSHPWGGHAGVDVRGVAQDGTRFAVGGRVVGTRGYDFTTMAAEPDDDGFLLGSLNFSLSKDFAWGEAYASALYSRSRGQYDGYGYPDEMDSTTIAGKVGARIDHAHDWHSRVEVSLGYDEQDNFLKGTPLRDAYETLRYGAFAATTKEFETGSAAHSLTVGGEIYRESINSTATFSESSRVLAAAFTQYSLELGALTVDSGLRYDHNERFGDATTYNLGASYEIASGLVARASYATGFRGPSFNELYGSSAYGTGNPNLRPEQSKGYEVGLSWRPTAATVIDAAFYQSQVRDQISWDYSLFPAQPFNVQRVRTTGFEASLSHRFDERWRVHAAFDVRDSRDDAGVRLASQERFKATAGFGFRATEDLDLTAQLRRVEYGNPAMLPSYTLLDIGAVYTFDAASELKLTVENLFDKDYATAAGGYRAPGRTINFSYSRTF